MLVISRKRMESLVIDDQIRITVVEIRDDRVRLGIDAPANVPVHREEVYRMLRREAVQRSSPPPDALDQFLG